MLDVRSPHSTRLSVAQLAIPRIAVEIKIDYQTRNSTNSKLMTEIGLNLVTSALRFQLPDRNRGKIAREVERYR